MFKKGCYYTMANNHQVSTSHIECQTMLRKWNNVSKTKEETSCKVTSPDMMDFILISPWKMDCSRKITYKHLMMLPPQSPVRNFHTGPSNMSLSFRPCLTDQDVGTCQLKNRRRLLLRGFGTLCILPNRRACAQHFLKQKKTDEISGHFIAAASQRFPVKMGL